MSNQEKVLDNRAAEVAEAKVASHLRKDSDHVFVRAHSLGFYGNDSVGGGSWKVTATVVKRTGTWISQKDETLPWYCFEVTMYKSILVPHDGSINNLSGWGIGTFKNLDDALDVASALTKAEQV